MKSYMAFFSFFRDKKGQVNFFDLLASTFYKRKIIFKYQKVRKVIMSE